MWDINQGVKTDNSKRDKKKINSRIRELVEYIFATLGILYFDSLTKRR